MQYICRTCGWIYKESVEEQPFNDLSEDFVCPICGAEKNMFSAE